VFTKQYCKIIPNLVMSATWMNSVSAGLNFVKFQLGILVKFFVTSRLCLKFDNNIRYFICTPFYIYGYTRYFPAICLYIQNRLCSLRGASWDRRKSWRSKYKCRAWTISLPFRVYIIICCKFVRKIQRKGVVLCKTWKGSFKIIASSVFFNNYQLITN